MKPKPSIRRPYALCLVFLAGVLVLGIVQWSFLPILIQQAPANRAPSLELSSGHTSKFAAPFKCLFGDGPSPYLAPSRVTVKRIASAIVRLPDAPPAGQDQFSLACRSLRAPPFA